MSTTVYQAKAIGGGRSGRAWIGGLGAALAVGGALAAAAVLTRGPDAATVALPAARPDAAVVAISVPVAPALAGNLVEGLQGYEWRSMAAPTIDGTVVEGLDGYRVVPRAADASGSSAAGGSVASLAFDGVLIEGLQGYSFVRPTVAAPAAPFGGFLVEGLDGYRFVAEPTGAGSVHEGLQGYAWRPLPRR